MNTTLFLFVFVILPSACWGSAFPSSSVAIEDFLFPLEGGRSYAGTLLPSSMEGRSIFSYIKSKMREPEASGSASQSKRILGRRRFGEYNVVYFNTYDTRAKVEKSEVYSYPWRTILSLRCRMIVEEGGRFVPQYLHSTATIIWKNIALTAAHNVVRWVEGNIKSPERIVCCLSGCKEGEPSDKDILCEVSAFVIPEQYMRYIRLPEKRRAPYDYAVMYLRGKHDTSEEKVGDLYGYIFPKSVKLELPSEVAISGYPLEIFDKISEKNEIKPIDSTEHELPEDLIYHRPIYSELNPLCQYGSTGTAAIAIAQDVPEYQKLLSHNMQTSSGQSGASLLVQEAPAALESLRIVGIHTMGQEPLTKANIPGFAVKMTDELLDTITIWARSLERLSGLRDSSIKRLACGGLLFDLGGGD